MNATKNSRTMAHRKFRRFLAMNSMVRPQVKAICDAVSPAADIKRKTIYRLNNSRKIPDQEDRFARCWKYETEGRFRQVTCCRVAVWAAFCRRTADCVLPG